MGRLRGTPIDAVMLPVPSKFEVDPALAPMLAVPDLRVALATSARPENLTIEGFADVIPGFTNFFDHFAQYTAGVSLPEPPYSLPTGVDCDDDHPICASGKRFLELKRRLLDDKIFKCDLWKDSRGRPCDPKGMSKNELGEWVNDCLITDANGTRTLSPMPRMCNLPDFAEYVQEFSLRLERSVERLADVSISYMEDLRVTLRGILDRHLFEPIADIVDGFTCGYMPPAYADFINGMCFQGVVGVREVGRSSSIAGICALVMAITLYFAWRIESDNVHIQASSQGSQ